MLRTIKSFITYKPTRQSLGVDVNQHQCPSIYEGRVVRLARLLLMKQYVLVLVYAVRDRWLIGWKVGLEGKGVVRERGCLLDKELIGWGCVYQSFVMITSLKWAFTNSEVCELTSSSWAYLMQFCRLRRLIGRGGQISHARHYRFEISTKSENSTHSTTKT